MILGLDSGDEPHLRRTGGHSSSESRSHSHSYSRITSTMTVEGEEVIVDTETSTEWETEERYYGIVDAAQKIYAEEGLAGFYTGVVEETVGTLGSAFWYFAACMSPQTF